MSDESIAHIIRNILQQCSSTTISIGHAEGHFLSSKQFAVLEECADTLTAIELSGTAEVASLSAVATSSEEADIRSRRLQLARDIKQKQILLTAATPSDRSQINQDIGKLLSERAKLDKLIKQFDNVSLA